MVQNELSENYVEINPGDDQRLGIHKGNRVRASSIRGSVEVKARVSEKVEQGTVFMPFHFPESLTNALTNDALDPISKTPEYKVCAICIEKMPQRAKEGVRKEEAEGDLQRII